MDCFRLSQHCISLQCILNLIESCWIAWQYTELHVDCFWLGQIALYLLCLIAWQHIILGCIRLGLAALLCIALYCYCKTVFFLCSIHRYENDRDAFKQKVNISLRTCLNELHLPLADDPHAIRWGQDAF